MSRSANHRLTIPRTLVTLPHTLTDGNTVCFSFLFGSSYEIVRCSEGPWMERRLDSVVHGNSLILYALFLVN